MSTNVARSDIADSFNGQRVFITGATGFLGSVLLRKLLKECGERIAQIYLLVRCKNNEGGTARMQKLLRDPVRYHHCERGSYKECILLALRGCAFEGRDLVGKNHRGTRRHIQAKLRTGTFGMGGVDAKGGYKLPPLPPRSDILRTFQVSIIFHMAATIKFNESLKTAATLNVRAVMEIKAFAKQCANLRSIVYVGTAYSQCATESFIEEKFYEPPLFTPEQFVKMAEEHSEEQLEALCAE